jgi:hypothetical protein
MKLKKLQSRPWVILFAAGLLVSVIGSVIGSVMAPWSAAHAADEDSGIGRTQPENANDLVVQPVLVPPEQKITREGQAEAIKKNYVKSAGDSARSETSPGSGTGGGSGSGKSSPKPSAKKR